MNNTVNNLKRLPVIMGHFPAGTSSKNMLHFQQFVLKGEFKEFDYGEKKNMIHYGQKNHLSITFQRLLFPHIYMLENTINLLM